jgi:Helix-turn-helix domain
MPVELTTINNQLTDSPVEPGRFLAPEFLDVDQVRIYFGIKQSLLYRLLAENKIRAVSIRQRGKTRGRRLFDVASIRAFLNSQVDKDGEK